MTPTHDAIERHIHESRGQLLGFIRARVSDPDTAEDILQSSLLKALQNAGSLRDEQRLVPWFYQIVRNAITDTYRSRGREASGLERLSAEPTVDHVMSPADERTICGCFRRLVGTLPPQYAEVIEALDLGDETPAGLAERLGITRNNLKVRRHRARQQLRERIQECCGPCADASCTDCTCA